MYDVIVIGAGPAGCAAAKYAAETGKSVLLLERFALPRYKSCSGVLIKKSLELTERYFGEHVPGKAFCTPIENRGMVFTDDDGREYRFEQEGGNVWRSEYDYWLAKKAESAGVELRAETSAITCVQTADHIEVTLSPPCGEPFCTERARYVIDCEGVTGAFKRRVLKTSERYIVTYQTFNDGSVDLDPHYFYAYLQPGLSGYDAWFNVKDDRIVLGVSAEDAGKLEGYYAKFLEYMRREHGLSLEQRLKEEKWLMPLITDEFSLALSSGRVFFAGEAAGFLNPMGEGVSSALESGHLAAHAVCENLSEPDKAAAFYEKETQSLRTYMERQWRFVAGISKKFLARFPR